MSDEGTEQRGENVMTVLGHRQHFVTVYHEPGASHNPLPRNFSIYL